MSTPRENSVKHLCDLYNVVIGIALSLSIISIVDGANKPVPIKSEMLLTFITFIIILIPFYHGAIRHLYATYIENGGSTRIKSGALFVDYAILFIEGGMFVAAAALVGDHESFTYVIIAILVVDSIWGLLAWLAFTGASSQKAEKIWALINISASLILGVFITSMLMLSAEWNEYAQIIVFIIILGRTIFDYYFSWSFYYPQYAPGQERETPPPAGAEGH